jgi:hypothetical protein
MKKFKLLSFLFLTMSFFIFSSSSCGRYEATTAVKEQQQTEVNQAQLNKTQPAPRITWSLERDNLIKRFKLQNDRAVTFFMYIFIEGVGEPIGYYQVNKVSSVNSQLTNTMQLVAQRVEYNGGYEYINGALPRPAEDGSYGENGDAIFGFTPEGIYIETNMKYVTSTVPLNFRNPVNRLAIITTDQAKQILDISKKAME